MTEQESAEKAVVAGVAKAQLLARQPGRYWLRAIMAGLYLSLVVMTFWALHQGLRGSPFGKVIASAFFGVGLSIIVFTESELFTSNCFYLAISSFAKKTTWRQAGAVWVCSWVGNLIGALLLAGVFRAAGVFESFSAEHALYTGAQHKADQTIAMLFWKGVLANWIVCLAVWIGLRLKEEIAKTTAIILVVFTFLYLGFEHSIANMGTFAFALVSSDAVTPSAAMRNLAVTTLGNLAGGAVLVGWVYSVLGRVRKTGLASTKAEAPTQVAFD
jgi:nitrite transporter NirC